MSGSDRAADRWREDYAIGDQVRQQVIATLGRFEGLQASGQLEPGGCTRAARSQRKWGRDGTGLDSNARPQARATRDPAR